MKAINTFLYKCIHLCRMRILLSLEVLLEKCLTVVTEVTSLRIENSGIFLTELIMLLKHQGDIII